MRPPAALAALGLVASLGLAACSDDGTPVSTEAFCTRLADLRSRNPLEDAATDEEAADEVAAILDELIETSPQQVRADLRRFRRLVDDLRNLDTSDPEAAAEAVQDLATPELLSSAESLADFAREECGFSDVFETGGG